MVGISGQWLRCSRVENKTKINETLLFLAADNRLYSFSGMSITQKSRKSFWGTDQL